MSQSKRRLLELNARLAQNLTDKDVEATADETTTTLVDKVVDIPDKYDEGYSTGYNKGYEQSITDNVKEEQEKTVDITENGTTEVLPDDGKVLSKVSVNTNVVDSYYDAFWDNFQQNGARTNYSQAFCGEGWNENIFKPKYNLRFVGSMQYAFHRSKIEIDLIAKLKEWGLTFDTSEATSTHWFYQSSFLTLPTIHCLTGSAWFHSCNVLHTIEKIVTSKKVTWNSVFNGCTRLKNITFEGEIGSIFDIKWSPLTAESAKSIITHLVNYTGTENEFVYSVLFADSVWELLNAEGATAPGDITWEEYVASIGWKK